jgi:hypothetical protein
LEVLAQRALGGSIDRSIGETEKTKQEAGYKMTGLSIDGYLTKNGEFQWVPPPSACSDKEKAKGDSRRTRSDAGGQEEGLARQV